MAMKILVSAIALSVLPWSMRTSRVLSFRPDPFSRDNLWPSSIPRSSAQMADAEFLKQYQHIPRRGKL